MKTSVVQSKDLRQVSRFRYFGVFPKRQFIPVNLYLISGTEFTISQIAIVNVEAGCFHDVKVKSSYRRKKKVCQDYRGAHGQSCLGGLPKIDLSACGGVRTGHSAADRRGNGRVAIDHIYDLAAAGARRLRHHQSAQRNPSYAGWQDGRRKNRAAALSHRAIPYRFAGARLGKGAPGSAPSGTCHLSGRRGAIGQVAEQSDDLSTR